MKTIDITQTDDVIIMIPVAALGILELEGVFSITELEGVFDITELEGMTGDVVAATTLLFETRE